MQIISTLLVVLAVAGYAVGSDPNCAPNGVCDPHSDDVPNSCVVSISRRDGTKSSTGCSDGVKCCLSKDPGPNDIFVEGYCDGTSPYGSMNPQDCF
ncbi:hypothetical protein BCV70DRAFT_200861 [Testicularia cyperi]|uniref:Hydrophobin n=1 Tax=Testicularia cyperi TaxID=1882483 RepID=A0A317XLT0_9BASI|nr:hypothetical protein BCV70DRAFT_200861 [Testicularia cyperi]